MPMKALPIQAGRWCSRGIFDTGCPCSVHRWPGCTWRSGKLPMAPEAEVENSTAVFLEVKLLPTAAFAPDLSGGV